MTDNAGGCDVCGASYADGDFGTDGNGNLVEFHVCDTRAIARQRQRFIPFGGQAITCECIDCDRLFTGTKSSIRCPDCRGLKTPDELRAIRLANLEIGRAKRCSECGRPRTKESERCRYHQRQNWIRKATIAANGRLVRPEEAA